MKRRWWRRRRAWCGLGCWRIAVRDEAVSARQEIWPRYAVLLAAFRRKILSKAGSLVRYYARSFTLLTWIASSKHHGCSSEIGKRQIADRLLPWMPTHLWCAISHPRSVRKKLMPCWIAIVSNSNVADLDSGLPSWRPRTSSLDSSGLGCLRSRRTLHHASRLAGGWLRVSGTKGSRLKGRGQSCSTRSKRFRWPKLFRSLPSGICRRGGWWRREDWLGIHRMILTIQVYRKNMLFVSMSFTGRADDDKLPASLCSVNARFLTPAFCRLSKIVGREHRSLKRSAVIETDYPPHIGITLIPRGAVS